MKQAVIVEAVRTPIGRFRGGLKAIRPDDMAALVIAEVVRRARIDGGIVEEVFFGCANQAGEDNRNVARMATLLAGLPHHVPAVTINRLCASGLEAVNQAARMIMLGDADVVIAGGVESMTRAPLSMPKPAVAFPVGNQTIYDTTLGWRYPNPKMEAMFPLEAMGCTAENLADRYDISREAQDAWALESHTRAIAAQDAGRFVDEILPVSTPVRRKPPVLVSADEGPRRGSSMEALARLRPAFREGGSVTAGNSSTLNDGACALLLMSAERAKAMGLTPMARVRAMGSAGVDPVMMGIGPVPATKKALARANLTIEDIDLIEVNEAFSAQLLSVKRELGLKDDRVNVNGGAIALGHPLGCSGARILTTLIYEMQRRDVNLGLATLCVGVGQGVSTIIERYNG